tara:strand:+ start:116 stop:229 length:114 start_codon:yes stop_codon:yes gene_type:complete
MHIQPSWINVSIRIQSNKNMLKIKLLGLFNTDVEAYD